MSSFWFNQYWESLWKDSVNVHISSRIIRPHSSLVILFKSCKFFGSSQYPLVQYIPHFFNNIDFCARSQSIKDLYFHTSYIPHSFSRPMRPILVLQKKVAVNWEKFTSASKFREVNIQNRSISLRRQISWKFFRGVLPF